MKSLGWALILLDWYFLRKGHLDSQRNTRGALATEYIHTHRGDSYETKWEVGHLQANERALQRKTQKQKNSIAP